MAVDPTIALIELDEFKKLAGIKPEPNDKDDTAIENYINAASVMVENMTGRKWLAATATDEMFPGTGTYAYYVKNGNLKAVSSAPSYWNGTGWTATTQSYTTDLTKGKVYFTRGGTFHCHSTQTPDYPNWKITYTYGYTLLTMPAPLKLAVTGLVQLMIQLNLEGKIGMTSESKGDLMTSYIIHQIPDNIRLMLAPYRHLEFR